MGCGDRVNAPAPWPARQRTGGTPFAFIVDRKPNCQIALEVRNADAHPVLTLHKPWFRMTVTVTDAGGHPRGTISKQIRVGKARFSLTDATGQLLGSVLAENWRAKDFSVRDPMDQEVARVTKKWEGFARAIFTDADNYVVELPETLREPLRSLAIASALSIDTIMKQKDY